MRNMRTKIWIDRFQTSLSIRLAVYFVLYQCAVWALILSTRYICDVLESLLGPTVAFVFGVFGALVIVLLGGLAIYDALCFTHRVVGPLFRFRQVMKAIADGEEVALVTLRKGDFLVELQDDFNAMLTALQQRGAVTLKPSHAQQENKETISV